MDTRQKSACVSNVSEKERDPENLENSFASELRKRVLVSRICQTKLRTDNNCSSFLFDIGATDNLVGDLKGLKNIRKLNSDVEVIGVSDEFVLNATHRAEMTVVVRNLHDEVCEFDIDEVYYVPNLGINLIS